MIIAAIVKDFLLFEALSALLHQDLSTYRVYFQRTETYIVM